MFVRDSGIKYKTEDRWEIFGLGIKSQGKRAIEDKLLVLFSING